jgi:septal ring factor EnvC (AmiA/AmiB activator)
MARRRHDTAAAAGRNAPAAGRRQATAGRQNSPRIVIHIPPIRNKAATMMNRSKVMKHVVRRDVAKCADATCAAAVFATVCLAMFPAAAKAQDVPGIEICTRESQMDRRTGCLQSNVEFLQKVMTKNALEGQQKLSAAGREIAALKEQLAAAGRDAAALRQALAAMEARIAQLEKAAPQPKADGKK